MTEAAQIETPAPPATPAEASTRLDQLKANPTWTKAFLAGAVENVQQFRELHELIAKGDEIDAAIAGVLPETPSSDMRQMVGTAELLKGMGFPPLAIRETLSGKEASQIDIDRATAWKAQNLKSKEFADRLFKGDPGAARELMVANIILSSPVKKEKA
jgi:hypothetical protein